VNEGGRKNGTESHRARTQSGALQYGAIIGRRRAGQVDASNSQFIYEGYEGSESKASPNWRPGAPTRERTQSSPEARAGGQGERKNTVERLPEGVVGASDLPTLTWKKLLP